MNDFKFAFRPYKFLHEFYSHHPMLSGTHQTVPEIMPAGHLNHQSVRWNGWGGIKVSFDWMVRVPLVQSYHVVDISVKKIEIHRKGKDGLVCKDNIRADITVAFYIRVDATEESVRKVAQMLTPERVSDIEQLRQLFEAKFSEALKTAGKQMEFHSLFTERITFRDQIQSTIGKDLDGKRLEAEESIRLRTAPLPRPLQCLPPRLQR